MNIKEEIHTFDIDDYLLIVNGEIWSVSGNSDFSLNLITPKAIPKYAKVTCVKIVRYDNG